MPKRTIFRYPGAFVEIPKFDKVISSPKSGSNWLPWFLQLGTVITTLPQKLGDKLPPVLLLGYEYYFTNDCRLAFLYILRALFLSCTYFTFLGKKLKQNQENIYYF